MTVKISALQRETPPPADGQLGKGGGEMGQKEITDRFTYANK